jgi:hypothetical protein
LRFVVRCRRTGGGRTGGARRAHGFMWM